MIVAALVLVATTSVAGPCVTDSRGPNCPPNGVRHAMIGVVDGRRVQFEGWHDRDGKRKYEPGENPQLDRLLENTTGQVANFGVDLPKAGPGPVAHGPVVRTNDAEFGRWNSDVGEAESRPCPGPGPCPNPSPAPTPNPYPKLPESDRAGEAKLAYLIAAALGAAALFMFLGAAVVGLTTRKA